MELLFNPMKAYGLALLLLCLLLTACGGAAPAEEAVAEAAEPKTTDLPTETPVPPTSTPTETPVPPTNTPPPTETPMPPTNTPVPTETPSPTPTTLPPTSTPTLAATPLPPATPTQPPTAEVLVSQSPLEIIWPEQMNYENRTGESLWCQVSVTYHNHSQQTYNWPDYQPAFLLFNADGSEAGGYLGNYYSKADGWPNGIEGEPQPIPAGSSADWTWYTATDTPNQYCGLVYIEFQGWGHAAAYDPQGKLIETDTFPVEQ